MLKTIHVFAMVAFLAGGFHLLSADEPSPTSKKSKATIEENRVSSRLAGGTDQVKEDGERPPIVLDALLAAWRKRAKNTPAVRVSWKEQAIILPAGLASVAVAKRRFPERFWKTGVPAKKISFKYDAQLLLDGNRVRFETQVIAVDGNFDVYTKPYVSSFDGNSSRMLFSGGRGKPSGSIRQEQHNVDAKCYVLHPLFLFMRPLSHTYGTLDENLLQFANSETEQAIVLKQQELGITDFVWLDDDSHSVVTRWEQHVNKPNHPTSPGIKLAITADIEYASDPNLGHVPVSWSIVAYDTARNTIRKQYKATDVKFEVLQQPVPQSEFVLEFPTGTEVYDHQAKRSFIAVRTEK